MNKNNCGGGMKPSEVVAEVNRLEISPSKHAGGSSAQPSPSVGGGHTASGHVSEMKGHEFGRKKKDR